MNIRQVRHRGLKRLLEDDDDRGIRVSGNWRITFDDDGDEIRNLDLEDYH